MENTSLINTNARTARLRSGLSGNTGMPGLFRIGDHEIAPGASVLSCGVAAIGEQGKGDRVSVGGEDM